VQHSKGPLGLGTLAVMPIRHVVHVSDLSRSESAELGPLLQRTSAAVTAIMSPEQVYVCLWSHADAVPGHLHFVVQPAFRDDMTRHNAYGPVLQLAMSEANRLPSKAAVEEVCVRIRAELHASG
jgi:diadenosine tetraphosphate (Ap4A) HIT family hydrolase